MELKTSWVIILIPFVLAFVWWFQRFIRPPALRIPYAGLVSSLKSTWKLRLRMLPLILRSTALVLFLIALAGPRSVLEETKSQTEGVDIVLTIDSSQSMAAEDFKIQGKRLNRLNVVKSVVKEFIDARESDRISLVAFAGLAYTVSPLTTDYQWLKSNLDRVEFDLIESGTNIGSALSASLARLRRSEAKSKVIILLTDGVNNTGRIDPVQAAQAAKALGIKVYTIGAGTNGYAPFPVKDIWGRVRYQKIRIEIDEAMLSKIATITGGRYFRATDTKSLQEIYAEIDKLEKTVIEELSFRDYQELFGIVLVAALFFLLLEQILSNTLLLRLP